MDANVHQFSSSYVSIITQMLKGVYVFIYTHNRIVYTHIKTLLTLNLYLEQE